VVSVRVAGTLARTERTQGGPQHAAYEFDLTGTGDMVVTDVRTTQAGLVLTPELAGRISVREAGGALVAELRKPAGNTVELGLDAGTYVVALESGATSFETQVTLTAGEHAHARAGGLPPGRAARWRSRAATALPSRCRPPRSAQAGDAPAPDHLVQGGHHPALSTDATTDVDGFSFGFIADRASLPARVPAHARLRPGGTRCSAACSSVGANLVWQRLSGAQITVGANVARRQRAGRAAGRRRQRPRRHLRGVQMVSGGTW
jgi:hypothetical protein